MNIKIATLMAAQVFRNCMNIITTLNLFFYLVDCVWGAWSSWETCSVTCGGGTQERNRTITQPALNNGTDCVGNDTDTQSCNNDGCPGIFTIQLRKSILLSIFLFFNFTQLIALGVHGVHGKPAL